MKSAEGKSPFWPRNFEVIAQISAHSNLEAGHMFLKVNRRTLEVERLNVSHLSEVPGTTNNGQHEQLDGHVLVKVHFPSGNMLLLHSDTEPSTGHVDLIYRPHRSDHEYGVEILRDSHSEPLRFSDDSAVKHAWPDGQWHLLRTIDAIEQFLATEIGYQPVLSNYIGFTFLPTPPQNKPASESAAA